MESDQKDELTRREREVMNILYPAGALSAEEILARMADPPTNSAVRSILRVLQEKGHLRRSAVGRKFLYTPTVSRQQARIGVLQQMVKVFFDDSPDEALAALLEMPDAELSEATLERLESVIAKARQEGH